MNNAWLSSQANQKVLRLYISVYESVFVYSRESPDQLGHDHTRSLQRELFTTVVEQIFKWWTQEIHDHESYIPFLSEVVQCCESL